MKSKILGLLAVGLLAGPMAANAVAVLAAEFVNNNPTLAPTDDIVMLVEITNSGDTAGGFGGASVGLGNWYSQYGTGFNFGNYYATVAPGTSLIVQFFTIFGSADIAAGQYFTSAASIGAVQLGSFNWTITAVPEPGTLALLGLGLAGLVFTRRRDRQATKV